MKSSGGVQSLHRALDMLEIISRHRGHMAIGDIAASCGLPAPTAHRLLKTLHDRGYIRRLSNRHYALGSRLLSLGMSVHASIGEDARGFLASIVEEFEVTALLAVLSGNKAEYLSHVPSPHTSRVVIQLGRKVDLHSTSVGKIILASLPDTEVSEIIRRAGLPKATPNTICDEDALMDELRRVRTSGYAIGDQELELGIRSAAVLLPGTEFAPMALSINGTPARITNELIERAVPFLHDVAADFSRQIFGPPAVDEADRVRAL